MVCLENESDLKLSVALTSDAYTSMCSKKDIYIDSAI